MKVLFEPVLEQWSSGSKGKVGTQERRTKSSAALPVRGGGLGAAEPPFAEDIVGDVENAAAKSMVAPDASRNGFRDTGRGGGSEEIVGEAARLRKGLLDNKLGERLGERPGEPEPKPESVETSCSS